MGEAEYMKFWSSLWFWHSKEIHRQVCHNTKQAAQQQTISKLTYLSGTRQGKEASGTATCNLQLSINGIAWQVCVKKISCLTCRQATTALVVDVQRWREASEAKKKQLGPVQVQGGCRAE